MFSLSHSATNKEQVGEAYLQSIQSPQKIWTIHVPQLSITDWKVKVAIALRFQHVHVEFDPQKHLITHGCNYTRS